jgi:hypothetical protein
MKRNIIIIIFVVIGMYCIILSWPYINDKFDYIERQKVGKDICSELKEIVTKNSEIEYNDEHIKIENYTNNKYHGFFYFNSNKEIVLLNVKYFYTSCNGTCGKNVVCKADDTVDFYS